MFTATIIKNAQNLTGDIETVVEFSSDTVSAFQESIPNNANGDTVLNTIQNRLKQLQGAYDFVSANPAGTVIEAIPTDLATVKISAISPTPLGIKQIL